MYNTKSSGIENTIELCGLITIYVVIMLCCENPSIVYKCITWIVVYTVKPLVSIKLTLTVVTYTLYVITIIS